MSYMEKSVLIKAPAKSIFQILADPCLAIKWNITVKGIEELGLDKYRVIGILGDFIINRVELEENKKVSYDIEGNIFNSMGYVLSPKGFQTEALLWAKFEEKRYKRILLDAGELLLNNLKRFIDYLEDGGEIDEFDKKLVLLQT